MKKLRTKILVIIAAVLLFLGYTFYFTVPYLQTFGQSYEFRNNYYYWAYISTAVSNVPSHYLTPDGRVLRYSRRMNDVVSDAKAVCRVPLTKRNFDDLFRDGMWTHSSNHVKIDAAWLRENCKAAWLGYSYLEERLRLHYILKLNDGNVVVCDSNVISWGETNEIYLQEASYYAPCGNAFEFYKSAIEQIHKNNSQN